VGLHNDGRGMTVRHDFAVLDAIGNRLMGEACRYGGSGASSDVVRGISWQTLEEATGLGADPLAASMSRLLEKGLVTPGGSVEEPAGRLPDRRRPFDVRVTDIGRRVLEAVAWEADQWI